MSGFNDAAKSAANINFMLRAFGDEVLPAITSGRMGYWLAAVRAYLDLVEVQDVQPIHKREQVTP